MERIVLRLSRRYHYRKLTVGLALLGVGAALLMLDLPAWIGWSLAALGGVLALMQLRALGKEVERVVIDDSGIRDSIFPVGVIGWNEVRAASVQEIGGVSVVALQLHDPERVIRRLPPARQFIARKALEAGLPGIYLSLVGTDGDPHSIAEAINRRTENAR
jgi:hypothetical protein